MATTIAEFKELAVELKAEFSDFFIDRTFSEKGTYDPVTGTYGAATETVVPCVRIDYAQDQVDGKLIQSNDFALLALSDDFGSLVPNTDGLRVSVDGKDCSVIRATIDPASAVWELQVRHG